MTYGRDAKFSNLTKTYWYLDTGAMMSSNSIVDRHPATENGGFIHQWTRLSGSGGV